MPRARTQKQGTKMLCESLRLVFDLNREIAKDSANSAKDRKDAANDAERARADAEGWGCTWAQRV